MGKVPKWQQRVASRTAAMLQRFGGPKMGGGLKVSSEAPPLLTKDWINHPDTTSQEEGNHEAVFIEFWSTQCPPCVDTVPKIKRLYSGYNNKVSFRTIHVDLYSPPATNSEIQDFITNHSIQYPVGIDHTGFMWDRFAFTHLPHGVLIDKDRRVMWSGSLFLNNIETVFEQFFGPPVQNNEINEADENFEATDEQAKRPYSSPECKGGVCVRKPPATDEVKGNNKRKLKESAVECKGGICVRKT